MAHLAHFLLKFPGPISPSNLSCCPSIYTAARQQQQGMQRHSHRRHMQSYALNEARRRAQIRLRDLQSSAGHGSRAHSEGWGSSSAFSNLAARLRARLQIGGHGELRSAQFPVTAIAADTDSASVFLCRGGPVA
jgi:hypothetical protein